MIVVGVAAGPRNRYHRVSQATHGRCGSQTSWHQERDGGGVAERRITHGNRVRESECLESITERSDTIKVFLHIAIGSVVLGASHRSWGFSCESHTPVFRTSNATTQIT